MSLSGQAKLAQSITLLMVFDGVILNPMKLVVLATFVALLFDGLTLNHMLDKFLLSI